MINVFFPLLMLCSVYDKSGLVFSFSGKTISISFFKTLLILIVLISIFDFKRGIRNKIKQNANKKYYVRYGILLILWTFSSFLGGVYTPGNIPITSEIYYFLQRVTYIIIPIIALKYRISTDRLLKFFIYGLFIHFLFVSLQYISTNTYFNFAHYVSDYIRKDNSFIWDGKSIAIFGLQRTSHYGSLVVVFALLALNLRPRFFTGKFLIYIFILTSTCLILFSGTRSVLIMLITSYLIYLYKTGRFKRLKNWIGLIWLLVIGVMFIAYFSLALQDFSSVYRFISTDSTGSDYGKRMIIQYATQLFKDSPFWGWGQKNFAYITYDYGNRLISTSEVHFYYINILIKSGLVGLIANLIIIFTIIKALWNRKDHNAILVCSLYVGLCVYGVVYDAGGLDIFACFNGIAACFALETDRNSINNKENATVKVQTVEE